MSTELANVDQALADPNIWRNLQSEGLAELGAEAKDVAGTRGEFLPYVQLTQGGSDTVKKALAGIACYYLVKNSKDEKQNKDLGKTLNVILLAWRPKAMDMRGAKPFSFHKPKSPEFVDIRSVADKGDKNSKCVYGPEFLLWSSDIGFYTFYLSSKSGRNCFKAFEKLLPDVATGAVRHAIITSTLVDDGDNSWFVPVINPSSVNNGEPSLKERFDVVSNFMKPIDSRKPTPEELAPSTVTMENR